MIPFRRIYSPTVQKGSLINFQYLFHHHDPNPLIMVTGVYSDGRIAGINLHYLSFVYVRKLIKTFCNDTTFNYSRIKGDRYIYSSFRTYKKTGIRNMHMMDCEMLNKILSVVRSLNFNPNEVMAIQNQIKQQLNSVQNRNANDLAGKMQNMLTPQQHNMFTMDRRIGPQLPPGPPPIPGMNL